MARYHSTNISPATAMILFHVDDGKILVTDWEGNQVEYDIADIVFTHELKGDVFSYFKENACLMGEGGISSETFEFWLPNWSSDGEALTARAWVE